MTFNYIEKIKNVTQYLKSVVEDLRKYHLGDETFSTPVTKDQNEFAVWYYDKVKKPEDFDSIGKYISFQFLENFYDKFYDAYASYFDTKAQPLKKSLFYNSESKRKDVLEKKFKKTEKLAEKLFTAVDLIIESAEKTNKVSEKNVAVDDSVNSDETISQETLASSPNEELNKFNDYEGFEDEKSTVETTEINEIENVKSDVVENSHLNEKITEETINHFDEITENVVDNNWETKVDETKEEPFQIEEELPENDFSNVDGNYDDVNKYQQENDEDNSSYEDDAYKANTDEDSYDDNEYNENTYGGNEFKESDSYGSNEDVNEFKEDNEDASNYNADEHKDNIEEASYEDINEFREDNEDASNYNTDEYKDNIDEASYEDINEFKEDKEEGTSYDDEHKQHNDDSNDEENEYDDDENEDDEDNEMDDIEKLKKMLRDDFENTLNSL